MVVEKPQQNIGNALLVNTDTVDLTWELRETQNNDDVHFGFRHTAGTALSFDTSDDTSGYSELEFMVEPNPSLSKIGQPYEIVTELIITKSGESVYQLSR